MQHNFVAVRNVTNITPAVELQWLWRHETHISDVLVLHKNEFTQMLELSSEKNEKRRSIYLFIHTRHKDQEASNTVDNKSTNGK